MESNQFAEVPLVGTSDPNSTDEPSSVASEDNEPPDISQNIQSEGSLEDPATQDPQLEGGKQHSKSRKATDSQQLKQSKAVPKIPTTNPSLLIFTAVATCQRKNGLSMQNLRKIVTNMGYDMNNKKQYFLRSIKTMVAKGLLLQVKGNGAMGSFKINPNMEKKRQQTKVKAKGQKAKEATKKKNVPAKARNGKNNAKKQGKVDSSKRVTKRSKIPPLQAGQSQVRV